MLRERAGNRAQRRDDGPGNRREHSGGAGSRNDRRNFRRLEGAALGVEDWADSRIYATTWSSSAEGDYVDIRPEPSDWFFGGGAPGDPKILDDALLELKRE